MNRRGWVPTWLRRFYAFNHVCRAQWIAEQAREVPAGSKILDVGAGSSPFRPYFSHCEYRAHDFAKLSNSQLWSGRGYAPLDYVSDIESIPVEDNSFDVILCTEVLEHVPEPIQAIKEISRILKPQGLLIMTAPLGSGLHQQPYHFYGGYTPYWYQKFLADAGFEQISIVPNGGFFQHYTQESLRFLHMSAPWHGGKQLLWLPFWLLSLTWGLFWAPFWGPILDKHMDEDKFFTIGYHVSAILGSKRLDADSNKEPTGISPVES